MNHTMNQVRTLEESRQRQRDARVRLQQNWTRVLDSAQTETEDERDGMQRAAADSARMAAPRLMRQFAGFLAELAGWMLFCVALAAVVCGAVWSALNDEEWY